MDRKRESRRRLRIGLITAGAVYALVLLCIFLVGRWTDKSEKEESFGDISARFSSGITKSYHGQTYEYRGNQIVNILLIGVDAEDSAAQDSGRFGSQADFILLLCIDKHRKTITPIQIDRDTMTDIQIYGVFGNPAGTRVTQICLAQAFGKTTDDGSRNTVQAVSRLLSGIPIDYYAAMDMGGISVLNEALGGITVTLEDDFSHLDPEMTAGATITLHGDQAELFVRNRRDVSDGTNASRMKRQRQYMDAALQVLLEKTKSDRDFLPEFYDEIAPQLTTDMSRSYILNDGYGYLKYDCGAIRFLSGLHTLGEDGFIEFYPDQEDMDTLVTDLFFQ